MLIALIGYGKVGRLHAQALSEKGHELMVVDPLHGPPHCPHFRSLRTISSTFTSRCDLWIIATPTETHVPILREILALEPSARVLLEKPACLPNEFSDLRDLRAAYPHARLAIHDTYGNSPVTDALIMRLSALNGADWLIKLEIEMSKNRLRDEALGRFQDTAWGPSGYEGFHLLALRRRLTEAFPLDARGVKLFTSSDGAITLRPELVSSAFSAPARALIEGGHIPFGSEFRFRLLKGTFASGLTFELAFEPGFCPHTAGYKNRHVLAWREGTTVRRVWLRGHHFACALHKQIANLVRFGGWQIAEGDHRLQDVTVSNSLQMTEVVV